MEAAEKFSNATPYLASHNILSHPIAIATAREVLRVAQVPLLAPLLATITSSLLDAALGRMTDSPFLNVVPLAAPQVILTRQFTTPQPGFVLYNLTDGAQTKALAGWFTRWLSNPNLQLSWASTTLTTTTQTRFNLRKYGKSLLLTLSIVLCLFLLASLDSSKVEMAHAGVMCLISAIPCMAVAALGDFLEHASHCGPVAVKKSAGHSLHHNDPVKALIQYPTGRLVRLETTRGMLFVLSMQHQPEIIPFNNRSVVVIYRILAWGLVIIQGLLLGMASPFYQLVVASIYIFFSICAYYGVGEDTSSIGGSSLQLTLSRQPGVDSNRELYARMQLNAIEEERMRAWHLFPLANEKWDEQYNLSKQNAVTNAQKPDTKAVGELE
ncbi:MAG: hypothetical protein Q9159_001658 [Coniocarpon cinnabarinum]